MIFFFFPVFFFNSTVQLQNTQIVETEFDSQQNVFHNLLLSSETDDKGILLHTTILTAIHELGFPSTCGTPYVLVSNLYF